MALEGFGAQMGDTVTLEVLCAGEGFPTTLLCADKATIIIMFPFMSEQLRHAGEGPATALRVTDKRPLTRMTSHMDFETAGFVIRLVAAWVGAGEVTRFPEVSAIVGEQGTEGDEGFLAAWEFTLVGPLRLKVDPLVIGESCSTAKPLAADLADEGVILLMYFDVSLEVVDCGETPPAAFKLTGVWPLLVMGLKMAF